MIRPVLYVDLPGIICAIDRRARSRHYELASFVCCPEPRERRFLLPPIIRNIFPFQLGSRTWICEDHWRILGFAQVQLRPSHTMWDLSYLASMLHRSIAKDDILTVLLEYILEMAPAQGILRIFAKVEDETPELDIFHRAGFQGYVRELTFTYPSAGLLPEIRVDTAKLQLTPKLPSLQRWNRHYAWGLHQLYRTLTPQLVQTAEMLEGSEECAKLYAGSLHRLPLPFSAGNENYVCDLGVRLGAWLRLCRGHGSSPHQLFLLVHPEHTELAEPLIQFGIRRLQANNAGKKQPIYCRVREYETCVITALRNSGFEQVSTKVLLVRHIALLAMNPRTVPPLEQRVAYGVKGLGTVNSRHVMR